MKISVFGEILWDVFDKEKAIGGAPFNFAAHAVKMGAQVNFISAIGEDELGREALLECSKLNIPTNSLAIVDKETGYCKVTLIDGTPDYNLVMDVAYDNIPLPGGDECADKSEGTCSGQSFMRKESDEFIPDVFYFGTLAQRASVSRDTLKKLINREKAANPELEVFFDINIRQYYYCDELIDESLKASTILKISREEIDVLNIDGTPEEICPVLMDKYPNLKLIIVTLDKDGAFAMERGGKVTYAPKPCCNVVSTVGAGDSFSAGFLVNYFNTGDIEDSLVKASALAGFVCEKVEAIPDYPKELLKKLNA